MDLKQYQRRVLDEVERYLDEVARQHADGNRRHAALDAWERLRLRGRYHDRRNGLGEDLPTFCIKVPTGGGKTVLATQVLGAIHRTILRERNGAGLVLWVVPSSQIYRDTLRRLRDRRDWYRVMLEHAVSRRLEIWEKHEIARLSATRLRDNLNILVLQLASTNRETREQLKFFRDSGGNIVQHFPPESDWEAHKALKQQVPNLDMLEDDESTHRHLAATSIGNLVRLCRPAVILDEGHKATSQLARSTIEEFNASVVVELSATPQREANVLSRVSGQELLDEQMIKLPLNIATSGQKSWKDVLTQARDKRDALARIAAEHAGSAAPDRLIRPIVLVQVERTGRDQREAGLIHSEQVKEYLMERLGVPEQAIAIKSAQRDELNVEGLDLLDPGCPVEWIITKSALQEGWDCPFAYILVSLNNTGSGRSMTQLVGRILRQPYQEFTPQKELNESYVYCLHSRAGDIARQVKTALEKEGYEGDLTAHIVDASRGNGRTDRTVRIKQHYLDMYRRPFEGKIYLPHFCVRDGDGYAALDYFRHLIARVDVERFEYDRIDWPIKQDQIAARDRFYRISLGEELTRVHESDAEPDAVETDEQVLGWIAANLPFEYLSHKQLRMALQRMYEQLVRRELFFRDRLALAKFVVRNRAENFIQDELDRQTEEAFIALHQSGRLQFYLECRECRFEIPREIQIRSTRPLAHEDGSPVARSLFDYVEHESANSYERAVALCLDRDVNVLWWYRNLVGPEHFQIQGYRRHRIRPDFVVQSGTETKPEHRVIVIESKGEHLEGSLDTQYKRKIADVFSDVGKQVTWQQLGEDFRDHVFRFQILDQAQAYGREWSDELAELLAPDA
ncbi:MAG TPA: DEAD/DEAH box helicase family protein [Planctomycetaceae bacterium]|nr:DEAD/DEAH box helicase family protein [Planctomycetaceae bacterium]